MSTPVYIQTPDVKNRPMGMLDAQGRVNPESYNDTAMRGDNGGGSNLVYIGKAKPGASEGALVWQIRFLAYDGDGNVTSITWPQNSFGAASNDYQFSWTDRASYTYS